MTRSSIIENWQEFFCVQAQAVLGRVQHARQNSSFLTVRLSISCTKPFINNDLNAHVVRVRFCPVVIMDALRPRRVGHIRPTVLVESWCAFQALLVDVECEAFVLRIKRQRAPRYGEQLLAHSKEAAKRYSSVRRRANCGNCLHKISASPTRPALSPQ